jgi:hypothetical protein
MTESGNIYQDPNNGDNLRQEFGGAYRETPAPVQQNGDSLNQGIVRRGIASLWNRVSPDLSPELKQTADQIFLGEHTMFKQPGAEVELYRGTRRSEPYVRIRSFDREAGFETSYLMRHDQAANEIEIRPEGPGSPQYELPGVYPIDPNERI